MNSKPFYLLQRFPVVYSPGHPQVSKSCLLVISIIFSLLLFYFWRVRVIPSVLWCCWLKVRVKVHALDIAPLRSESSPQKRSDMARVLKGSQSFTCTPTRSSAIGMSHTCLCLPSRSWYSFTDLWV